MSSEKDLKAWVADAITAFANASDLESLKNARLAHTGDKSPISQASRSLGSLPNEERASVGKVIGDAKNEIALALAQRTEDLEAQRDAKVLLEEVVDVTLPALHAHQGGLHPITIIKNEISDFFIAQGYSVAEGPELEAEWLNFDALNIPADHPARTMQDTFFVEPIGSGLVLRTHTSPVQIRTMLENEPPIYVICPGRTFRADELDATHTPVFHQVEGLVVDRGITMAHLKGTLDLFAQKMFGDTAITRLRPSFFPFTEPSAEVDVFFNGRWIEWGGCGMVNTKVLAACGVDSEIYSGFAFGMGLERTLMVRHGIKDMHDIVEGDLRFSRAFGVGL
ncbi:MAG: phenylalanine--tRNA ligase subunit alpha [Actinobacteria bacterium]|uniref:Phenylalanine--tRNA ligase alpha subunit n=1 Tax=freshwater metagenome TaxID=449393 RepID=A0A6J7IS56_9ZZZZ|nr:phenylalanine--tRNA ligase subunit alpha [Actinomycetota bacterium]MSX24691.1 phenylalanine--tRNA ligase subunit alpha [Actinomycetota bacterium]MSY46550.1 phenylalanine--tRNA ligase subunit alpha [Actinomycetota bacterium]MSY57382.1 phenylalanine--tRNA ligase subunit alpha [Actinomycetota bacterium]MTB00031.1 phenylalanine--tRNA ligase subunit alpha [Actinomycetota bacterium]